MHKNSKTRKSKQKPFLFWVKTIFIPERYSNLFKLSNLPLKFYKLPSLKNRTILCTEKNFIFIKFMYNQKFLKLNCLINNLNMISPSKPSQKSKRLRNKNLQMLKQSVILPIFFKKKETLLHS